MEPSTISRQGRGQNLQNSNGYFEQNTNDEMISEVFDLSERRELEGRQDHKHEERDKDTCFEWGTGDKSEMNEVEEEDAGENKNKWLEFLDDLYFKLSEYDIQKDREIYNVAHMDDWGQKGKKQGISVTTKSFKKFLDKIQNLNVAEYDAIKNLKITDSRIEKLNKVLSLTLNHTPSIKCSESNVVVKDNFISLNEIIRNLETNSHTDDSCKKFEDQLKKGKYNLLKIFALNKVFIDTDLMFKGGNIQIIDFGQNSKIIQHSAEGKEGEIGKGGIGGPGVKSGNDIIADVHLITTFPCFGECSASASWTYDKTEENGNTSTGNNGKDGENTEGMTDPVPAKSIGRLPNIINDYKIYLRANMKNDFHECTIRKFLDRIDKNNEVRKLYDILGLSGEFQDLEEQFFKLKKHMDISLFYNSFLERIEAFANDRKDILNSEENKKVLNYLYTAALGRNVSLKERSEENLIIDMRRYLGMVSDNIKKLKDLRNLNNKVDIINKFKNNYKDDFEEKIEEAKKLIDTQINPEINNISSKIDDQVKALIKETIDEQNKAEKDWEKLAEKKKALQSAMALKGLFNIFKIIGGAVSFLGPVGAIAGTVITGATTVLEPLALADKEKILSLPDPVAKDLKTLKGQIEAMRKEKLDYLDKLVKSLSTEIEKNPETLGDMTDKVTEIKGKLEKIGKKELEFKVAGELETQLQKDIKDKGIDLKKDTSDPKKLDAVQALEKVTKIVEFGSLFTKMHTEMEKDKEKMDTITKSMGEMEEKMRMLREYEKSIYETIAPMLQGMEDNMQDISNKLGTKSQVSLDVTKWQVQTTLKNIKFQMQKLTKSHEGVKDELKHNIENLGEVMTSMINIYDRIQDYQDQQNLANYIADVSSVASSSIDIKDQELVNVVNRLEFAIRANIVLEQYKKAIDGFKQWVFPFSERFMKNNMLPSNLEPERNIENLVQKAMKQIERIVQKLNMYDACIVNGDQSLVCEEFSSRFVSTEPFFVWKNEEYKAILSKLLSGEKVILKADVDQSVPKKDAIKFSEISFDWKLKNEDSQSQLDGILKGFDIKATHLGNSYYRYEDQTSLINSKKLKIAFSYEKDGDGMPIRANKVYYRLKSGDLMLSPYTLWKVQLIDATRKYSFKDLEPFRNDSYLELSGLGSYIDTKESKKRKRPKRESYYRPGGLKTCKRSAYRRSVRSLKGIRVDSTFATNDAPKVMSSPINFFCNVLRTYFITNIIGSIYPIFNGKQTHVKNEGSGFLGGYTEKKNTESTAGLNSKIQDSSVSSAKGDFIKDAIEKKSDFIFNVNFNGNKRCLNPFLLSDQKDSKIDKYDSTQFSDLNCTLMLADLVTRTMTRNKYKSSVGDYLLSPPEIISGKISRGAIRSESEVKEMLQRHLAEKEVERESSWLTKLNFYSDPILRFFGFVDIRDTEKYIQDIRHLFA